MDLHEGREGPIGRCVRGSRAAVLCVGAEGSGQINTAANRKRRRGRQGIRGWLLVTRPHAVAQANAAVLLEFYHYRAQHLGAATNHQPHRVDLRDRRCARPSRKASVPSRQSRDGFQAHTDRPGPVADRERAAMSEFASTLADVALELLSAPPRGPLRQRDGRKGSCGMGSQCASATSIKGLTRTHIGMDARGRCNG